MKPSLERAAPATSTVLTAPIPSLARKIMMFLLFRFSAPVNLRAKKPCPCLSCFKPGSGFGQRAKSQLLLVPTVGIYPYADRFFLPGHGYKGVVTGCFQRLDGRFDVKFLVGGVGNEGLGDVPWDGDVHVLFAGFVDHVDDQLPVLFRYAHIAVVLLNGDEFTFGSSLKRVQNCAYVHVCGEISNLDFAVLQLPMVDGGDNFLGERKRQIHADQLVCLWVAYPDVQITLP